MKNTCFSIADRVIGPDQPPFIVAELSANHNGDLAKALSIIDAIADAGADAVKLQTYTADTMTIDTKKEDFILNDGPWAGYSLYELYNAAHTPWEWHEALFDRGRRRGLIVFSSPFDHTSVDFLEKFDPPAYKIASFELNDLPLIEYVASKGKPMIMSTGMSTEIEIGEAVKSARDAGCSNICLMHCTSGYPVPANEADLCTIQNLAMNYNVIAGLSDHSLEKAVPIAAVALGACIIEKHVTLSRANKGLDASFSLEPAELSELTHDIRTAWDSIGRVRYKPQASEESQLHLRRSLYIVKDVKAGEILTSNNIRSVRPGYGLSPKYYKEVIGKKVLKDMYKGDPLTWEIISRSDSID